LAVAVYAFAYVFVEIPTSLIGGRKIKVPKAPVVQAMPIVTGPVVRDLFFSLPGEIVARYRERKGAGG